MALKSPVRALSRRIHPLQTLREYRLRFAEAHTTYGIIGVKVWVYKGDVFGKGEVEEEPQQPQRPRRSRGKGGRNNVAPKTCQI